MLCMLMYDLIRHDTFTFVTDNILLYGKFPGGSVIKVLQRYCQLMHHIFTCQTSRHVDSLMWVCLILNAKLSTHSYQTDVDIPLRSRWIRPPPPKKMSKMSKGEPKLGPPFPPSFMAFSPPRSYTSLFLASDKTSYACEICLNWV